MSIYKSCWVIAVLLLGVAFGQEPTTPSAEPVGPPAINSCSVPDTDAYRAFQTVYTWIQVVGMIISIVGSFLTILTFTIFSGIRTYPIKLICWLCVTVFCGQVLFLTVNQWAPGTGFCGYGGALIHYFFLCNFFWCFCLAFNFYQLIVKRNSQTRELEKWYHLIGWGIPMIFVIGVGAGDQYGWTLGGACYMGNPATRMQSLTVFLAFFLPGLLMVAANCVLFFFVASEIHGTLSKAPETEQKHKESSKELRVLISIFVTVGLSWVFGFFTALVSCVFILREIITLLFSFTAPLQGGFIFVAYCINIKVFNRWRGLFGCKVSADDTTSRTQSSRGGAGTSRTRSQNSSSSRVD